MGENARKRGARENIKPNFRNCRILHRYSTQTFSLGSLPKQRASAIVATPSLVPCGFCRSGDLPWGTFPDSKRTASLRTGWPT